MNKQSKREADYDSGLLSDWGGGNVAWWQDYIRAEVGRCNDYWRSRIEEQELQKQAIQDACNALEVSGRAVADIMHRKGEQDDPLLSERLSELWQACNRARCGYQYRQ